MAHLEPSSANDRTGIKPLLGRLGGGIALILASVILFAGGLYAIGDAILSDIPVSKSPGFIDVILASRAVVAAIRIAIIVAAAYTVISVVWLIGNGKFLVRVGPVHVSDQVSDLDAENRRLEESLDNARKAADTLRQKISATNQNC
jgi:hypothetical protein